MYVTLKTCRSYSVTLEKQLRKTYIHKQVVGWRANILLLIDSDTPSVCCLNHLFLMTQHKLGIQAAVLERSN